jgi:hypothetical protein
LGTLPGEVERKQPFGRLFAMTNISPRKQCLKGLRELLETGVRGNARTYIKMALDDVEGKEAKELTALEYEG